jgi:SAM-dependent methyltransferase
MASQERFGFKWDRHPEIFSQHRLQFEKWMYPLKASDFKGKKVLDVGCGIGRNAYFFLEEGANVTAFDYDQRTLDACKKNLAGFDNKEILYLSVYDMDWKNKFDLSFAIGTVHHLANQPMATKKMVDATKKGGKVLLWLYGRENNWWIVYIISPIRFFTSRLPLPITDLISYFFSVPLYVFTHLIPQRSPYLKQLSCFKFKHIHEIVFDHLLPRIAKYYTKGWAIKLLEQAGLSDVSAYHVNNNSWTVIGTKP